MSSQAVHTGFWINWSKYPEAVLSSVLNVHIGKGNSIVGGTITLYSREGNLLIAFLALIVHWTGSQFWGILCFVFHQIRSSPGANDGLFHQQQVILRNSITDTNALVWLFRSGWSWRRRVRQS